MKPVSVGDLKEKFPVMEVPPYGQCIVVPGRDFDPDWEVGLGDLGFKCSLTSLDMQPVTLVHLKRTVPEGKMVYVPERKAAAVDPPGDPRSNQVDVEVKETQKTNLEHSRWTKADEEKLLMAYDQLVSQGKKYGAFKNLPEFEDHSPNSVHQKLKKLLKKRKKVVGKSAGAETAQNAAAGGPAKGAVNPAPSPPPEQTVLEKAYKVFAAWKAEIDSRLDHLAANYASIEELEAVAAKLVKHKHATSGEAVVPLEASS